MARPVRKRLMRGDLTCVNVSGLRAVAPAKMEVRALLVLMKTTASMRHFL